MEERRPDPIPEARQFADWLTTRRRQCGFTQAAFAANVGKSSTTISSWENARSLPQRGARIAIARVLKVPLPEVLQLLGATEHSSTSKIVDIGRAGPDFSATDFSSSETERAAFLEILVQTLSSGRAGRDGVSLDSRDWMTLAAVLARHHGVDWTVSD